MTSSNLLTDDAEAAHHGWRWKAFWIWYGLAAALCAVAPEGRVFLGAIGLAAVWILVIRFRAPIRRLVALAPGPVWLRFFLAGIVFSDLIMENLAISFHGDLHKNLLVNSFLWLGAYLGWLSGWWMVSRHYQFNYQQVFFTAGATGILVEQNWMIPKLLASLQVFPVVVSAPILLVVYGAAIAPAFLLVPVSLLVPASGSPRRAFGVVAFLLGVALPLALFLAIGHFWIVLFKRLFGMN